MNKLVLIKLGGSVITDKNKGQSIFRQKVVAQLVQEIAGAKKKINFKLVLVHGAGAFGHPLAKKYKLTEGYLSEESLKGFSLTRQNVLKLSQLVLNQVLKAGLEASVVPPNSIVITSNGRVKSFDTKTIEEMIKLGITPILFGDVVFDFKKGFAILSGDKIVAYLAKKLKADQVLFISDVDGVFDKNPKLYKEAKLINEINPKNYQKILEGLSTFNKNDVTGEMRGKITTIAKSLRGVKVSVISGFTRGNVLKSLNGRPVGTAIIF